MTTNFRNSAGTDLDSLFDPYVQGTVPSATAFRTSDGTDLAGRFAPISYGSKGADVNMRISAGTDVSNLWAAYGTATYTLGFNGVKYVVSGLSGSDGSSAAQIKLIFYVDGTWAVLTKATTTGSTWTTEASGTWLPSGGSAANYSVEFDVSVSSYESEAPSITNGASAYSALSSERSVLVASDGYQEDPNGASGTIACLLKNSSGSITTSTLTFTLSAS